MLKCCICLDIMLDPVSSCSEEHAACRSCFERHIESAGGGKCPAGCGRAVGRFTLESRRALARLINERPARCSSGREDCGSVCTWSGTFGDLIAHRRVDCPDAEVACPHASVGCTVRVRRCELATHVAESAAEHLQLASAAVEQLRLEAELARLQIDGLVPTLVELRHDGRVPLSLPRRAVDFLGTYRLDGSRMAEGRPLWVHTARDVQCIAYFRQVGQYCTDPLPSP